MNLWVFVIVGVNHSAREGLGLRTVFAERAVSVHKGADVSSNVYVARRSNFGTNILWSYHVWCSGRLAESYTERLYAGIFLIHSDWQVLRPVFLPQINLPLTLI